MMNVNNMKGILGDAVSNEVRTLELRVGQVVRGVVLQQFPNNEATVSINGVQVRAKLEVPIMEGQASLLQVQPDSKGGQVHLKQVDPTALGLQDPMKDILKALSLPDKPWANELIKDLRKEGFALNKETAAAFQRAAQLMPAGVNQEQWMNAAATAFKRGLPMSEASIAAIHQLQSGAPAHQLLDQLRGQLSTLIQSNSATTSNALIMQLASLLDEGAELLTQLSGQPAGAGQLQQSNASSASSQAAVQQHNAGMQTAASTVQQHTSASVLQTSVPSQSTGMQQMNGQAASTTQQQAASEQTTAMTNQTTVNNQSNGANLLPQLLKWLGVSHEALLGKQVMQQPAAATAPLGQAAQQQSQMAQTQSSMQFGTAVSPAQQMAQQQVQQPHISAAQGAQQAAQPAAQQPVNQAAMPTTTSPAQSAGVAQSAPQAGIEQAISPAPQQGAQPPVGAAQPPAGAQTPLQADQGAVSSSQQQTHGIASQAGTLQAAGQQESPQVQQATIASQQMMQQTSHDNVKSAILQLLGQPDVSAQIKETAQQLLHAITGQQLMLSAERNHSVFSHITMFIPIKDANNGQTASVHIQTRRDRRGELDSENCRIVFDLQMKSLGPTLVDMSIVNKIVSLNLWNDHPAVAPIVEALKPEISETLYDHGYMLSSVRVTPIPIKEEEAVKQEEGRPIIIPPDIDQLSSTRYKGVDFKV